MDLETRIERMQTREDFVAFLGALIEVLQKNRDEWENHTLERYLEAAAAWTADSDGYYRNMKLPVPQNVPWKFFANILAAAVIYE